MVDKVSKRTKAANERPKSAVARYLVGMGNSTRTASALWQGIAAFDFDEAAPAGHFARKLARDNGWSSTYTLRVIEEYRRYAFLTCTAGHVVVPSEQVDQAWHQHLLDTQPYWDVFCKQVLQKPLHHRPSKGGIDDRQKHVELYERSLKSYADAFGHEPPADIWPPASQRFGRDLRQRRIALADHWIIPKLPVRRAAGVAAVAGLCISAIAAAPLVAGVIGINPFNWQGPEFLAFYTGLCAAAVVITLILRRRVVNGSAWPTLGDSHDDMLDPYEAATLNTNSHRAINAAIAALEHDGALAVIEETTGLVFKSKNYRLVQNGPLPAGALPLEKSVLAAVAKRDRGIPLSDVHERLKTTGAALIASLQTRGLLLPSDMNGRMFLIALPLLGVVAVGAVKIAVGVYRDRPVGFLILIGIVALIAAIAVSGTTKRTRRGSDALAAAKARHAGTKQKKLSREDITDGRHLSWLVAFYGPAILAGGSMMLLHSALTARATAGGGGDGTASAGCGGGGSSGDGGGGGGGCGGGGCGGCGG